MLIVAPVESKSAMYTEIKVCRFCSTIQGSEKHHEHTGTWISTWQAVVASGHTREWKAHRCVRKLVMNGNCLPKDKYLCLSSYMKVFRKVLSTWEQENNSLKSTNLLQIQLVSLDTEAVSQIFSFTLPGPLCSVIQCGHRCESQLQLLVPDSSSQPRLHCLRKLCHMKVYIIYWHSWMQEQRPKVYLLLLMHLNHANNTIGVNTFSSVLLSSKNKRS